MSIWPDSPERNSRSRRRGPTHLRFLSTLLGARTPFLSSADGLDTRCSSRPYVGLAVAGP